MNGAGWGDQSEKDPAADVAVPPRHRWRPAWRRHERKEAEAVAGMAHPRGRLERPEVPGAKVKEPGGMSRGAKDAGVRNSLRQ